MVGSKCSNCPGRLRGHVGRSRRTHCCGRGLYSSRRFLWTASERPGRRLARGHGCDPQGARRDAGESRGAARRRARNENHAPVSDPRCRDVDSLRLGAGSLAPPAAATGQSGGAGTKPAPAAKSKVIRPAAKKPATPPAPQPVVATTPTPAQPPPTIPMPIWCTAPISAASTRRRSIWRSSARRRTATPRR